MPNRNDVLIGRDINSFDVRRGDESKDFTTRFEMLYSESNSFRETTRESVSEFIDNVVQTPADRDEIYEIQASRPDDSLFYACLDFAERHSDRPGYAGFLAEAHEYDDVAKHIDQLVINYQDALSTAMPFNGSASMERDAVVQFRKVVLLCEAMRNDVYVKLPTGKEIVPNGIMVAMSIRNLLNANLFEALLYRALEKAFPPKERDVDISQRAPRMSADELSRVDAFGSVEKNGLLTSVTAREKFATIDRNELNETRRNNPDFAKVGGDIDMTAPRIARSELNNPSTRFDAYGISRNGVSFKLNDERISLNYSPLTVAIDKRNGNAYLCDGRGTIEAVLKDTGNSTFSVGERIRAVTQNGALDDQEFDKHKAEYLTYKESAIKNSDSVGIKIIALTDEKDDLVARKAQIEAAPGQYDQGIIGKIDAAVAAIETRLGELWRYVGDVAAADGKGDTIDLIARAPGNNDVEGLREVKEELHRIFPDDVDTGVDTERISARFEKVAEQVEKNGVIISDTAREELGTTRRNELNEARKDNPNFAKVGDVDMLGRKISSTEIEHANFRFDVYGVGRNATFKNGEDRVSLNYSPLTVVIDKKFGNAYLCDGLGTIESVLKDSGNTLSPGLRIEGAAQVGAVNDVDFQKHKEAYLTSKGENMKVDGAVTTQIEALNREKDFLSEKKGEIEARHVPGSVEVVSKIQEAISKIESRVEDLWNHVGAIADIRGSNDVLYLIASAPGGDFALNTRELHEEIAKFTPVDTDRNDTDKGSDTENRVLASGLPLGLVSREADPSFERGELAELRRDNSGFAKIGEIDMTGSKMDASALERPSAQYDIYGFGRNGVSFKLDDERVSLAYSPMTVAIDRRYGNAYLCDGRGRIEKVLFEGSHSLPQGGKIDYAVQKEAVADTNFAEHKEEYGRYFVEAAKSRVGDIQERIEKLQEQRSFALTHDSTLLSNRISSLWAHDEKIGRAEETWKGAVELVTSNPDGNTVIPFGTESWERTHGGVERTERPVEATSQVENNGLLLSDDARDRLGSDDKNSLFEARRINPDFAKVGDIDMAGQKLSVSSLSSPSARFDVYGAGRNGVSFRLNDERVSLNYSPLSVVIDKRFDNAYLCDGRGTVEAVLNKGTARTLSVGDVIKGAEQVGAVKDIFYDRHYSEYIDSAFGNTLSSESRVEAKKETLSAIAEKLQEAHGVVKDESLKERIHSGLNSVAVTYDKLTAYGNEIAATKERVEHSDLSFEAKKGIVVDGIIGAPDRGLPDNYISLLHDLEASGLGIGEIEVNDTDQKDSRVDTQENREDKQSPHDTETEQREPVDTESAERQMEDVGFVAVDEESDKADKHENHHEKDSAENAGKPLALPASAEESTKDTAVEERAEDEIEKPADSADDTEAVETAEQVESLQAEAERRDFIELDDLDRENVGAVDTKVEEAEERIGDTYDEISDAEHKLDVSEAVLKAEAAEAMKDGENISDIEAALDDVQELRSELREYSMRLDDRADMLDRADTTMDKVIELEALSELPSFEMHADKMESISEAIDKHTGELEKAVEAFGAGEEGDGDTSLYIEALKNADGNFSDFAERASSEYNAEVAIPQLVERMGAYLEDDTMSFKEDVIDPVATEIANSDRDVVMEALVHVIDREDVQEGESFAVLVSHCLELSDDGIAVAYSSIEEKLDESVGREIAYHMEHADLTWVEMTDDEDGAQSAIRFAYDDEDGNRVETEYLLHEDGFYRIVEDGFGGAEVETTPAEIKATVVGIVGDVFGSSIGRVVGDVIDDYIERNRDPSNISVSDMKAAIDDTMWISLPKSIDEMMLGLVEKGAWSEDKYKQIEQEINDEVDEAMVRDLIDAESSKPDFDFDGTEEIAAPEIEYRSDVDDFAENDTERAVGDDDYDEASPTDFVDLDY